MLEQRTSQGIWKAALMPEIKSGIVRNTTAFAQIKT
jgi:hypothetical protein